jgi:ABC-type antimicrobial peptide transport system permease subunit
MMVWSVTERRQEIAIRMALGASEGEMLRLVLRRALVISSAGIVIGLAAAPLATRTLRGLLYGIGPADPLTFGATAAGIVVVALLSAIGPALRATTSRLLR